MYPITRRAEARKARGMLISQVLVVALTATATATAVTVPTSAGPPAIDWRPCAASDPAGPECATLQVPVDWAHPDGETFGLAVARRKAPDRAARAGTLVFGPGGPGDSGVTLIRTGMDRFS